MMYHGGSDDSEQEEYPQVVLIQAIEVKRHQDFQWRGYEDRGG